MTCFKAIFSQNDTEKQYNNNRRRVKWPGAIFFSSKERHTTHCPGGFGKVGRSHTYGYRHSWHTVRIRRYQVSDIHQHLLALKEELRLTKYPQYSEGISLFQTKSLEAPQQFFAPGQMSFLQDSRKYTNAH